MASNVSDDPRLTSSRGPPTPGPARSDAGRKGCAAFHVAAGLGGHTLEDRSAIDAASGRCGAMSAVARRGFGKG